MRDTKSTKVLAERIAEHWIFSLCPAGLRRQVAGPVMSTPIIAIKVSHTLPFVGTRQQHFAAAMHLGPNYRTSTLTAISSCFQAESVPDLGPCQPEYFPLQDSFPQQHPRPSQHSRHASTPSESLLPTSSLRLERASCTAMVGFDHH